MPHEFYYVKNKERRDRRMTNLMFRNHERMLKGLKKLKKAEEQLSRHEPLYPQILRKNPQLLHEISQLRAATS